MVELRPFRALRPTPEAAARVASVPYDVVDTQEVRALIEGNPDSYLRVTRAEATWPERASPAVEAVYARGAETLADLRARGVLIQEDAASLYVYRLQVGEHTQTGVVGAFSVEDYDHDRILKHEHTRPDKEEDRTQHIQTLGAQTGPVFLIHRQTPALAEVVAQTVANAPLLDVHADDGVQHTIWRVEAPQPLVDAFAALPQAYVADGHHRSAAASNVRRRRREADGLQPDDPSHGFLAVSFPTDEVQILPYNRLVTDLGCTPAEFLARVQESAPVTLDTGPETSSPHEARLYLEGRWHTVTLTPEGDDPVARLAVQVLQDRVLGPLLGIEDPRRDPRLQFVGGSRGTHALAAAVDAGKAQAAWSMPAVRSEDLLAVADAGRTMPPKSTWFEPKLRSGLFTHLV